MALYMNIFCNNSHNLIPIYNNTFVKQIVPRGRASRSNIIQVKYLNPLILVAIPPTNLHMDSNFYAFLFCRGGRYTEHDAKSIVMQILNAASFIHLQGVVHRDLKPEVSVLYTIISIIF